MSQMVLVPYVPVTEEPSVWQRMFTDAPSATLLQASYPVPGAARTVSADPDVLTVPDAALAGPAVPRTADATAAAVIAVQRPNRASFRRGLVSDLRVAFEVAPDTSIGSTCRILPTPRCACPEPIQYARTAKGPQTRGARPWPRSR